MHSVERLLSGLFPTVSGPCDAQDYSSCSEVDGNEARIYLYDDVYDGVGLTFGAFDALDALVIKAAERLRTCECASDKGCFRCIANPFYDESASKNGCSTLLARIQQTLEAVVPRTQTIKSPGYSSTEEDDQIPCPSCGNIVAASANFCVNCGEKLRDQ